MKTYWDPYATRGKGRFAGRMPFGTSFVYPDMFEKAPTDFDPDDIISVDDYMTGEAWNIKARRALQERENDDMYVQRRNVGQYRGEPVGEEERYEPEGPEWGVEQYADEEIPEDEMVEVEWPWDEPISAALPIEDIDEEVPDIPPEPSKFPWAMTGLVVLGIVLVAKIK